ncbi:hypothetical protein TELCIR_05663 [Teladorsagia circumcincta]|uniref:Kinetochore protein Nuf2 N-terminal domain-containing protein n=1 Tax=Teladorsagia circumcincta TaxID=45464 RepID=A0A2G9URT1_TELCI|nr:hypothetical protein TELCIR_05663 [Teladorsagia circumcincta]
MDFGDVNSDFTMCDLINPHPKRTRKLFSLIADYTNFYRVAAQVFEKTSSEYDHARLAIEEGMEKNEIQHLSKGVVKSPVRVRNDVDEQRSIIKRLQESCDAERQRILDNNESMSVIEQVSKLLGERQKELERLRDAQAELNLLHHECANSEAQVAEASKYKTQREEALNRLVKLGEEEERSHRRALEVFSTRLQDLRMRKEDLISIMDSLRKNAPTIRDESVQLRNEMVRLRNERTEETELARRYCLELRSRFFDLLEKYHKAEKIFDAQAKAFSETIQNISMGLDDIELAAGDNSSLSD